MSSASWRGTVGVVKPTYGSGSLVEFIRLLPEGIGVIPLYVGLKEHTEEEYLAALKTYDQRVAELADIGVDLIHPEGAPPFMLRGYRSEKEIVDRWEKLHQIPIITSGMTQTEALRALGVKKFVGVTYYTGTMNDLFARYFADAGFTVLAMEGLSVPSGDRENLSPEEISNSVKKTFLKHPEAEGIYLLGSGGWRLTDVVPLELELKVPVIHPVSARVWSIQNRFHVKQPIKGAGRLLEEIA